MFDKFKQSIIDYRTLLIPLLFFTQGEGERGFGLRHAAPLWPNSGEPGIAPPRAAALARVRTDHQGARLGRADGSGATCGC